jgi:hypothetical protein
MKVTKVSLLLSLAALPLVFSCGGGSQVNNEEDQVDSLAISDTSVSLNVKIDSVISEISEKDLKSVDTITSGQAKVKEEKIEPEVLGDVDQFAGEWLMHKDSKGYATGAAVNDAHVKWLFDGSGKFKYFERSSPSESFSNEMSGDYKLNEDTKTITLIAGGHNMIMYYEIVEGFSNAVFKWSKTSDFADWEQFLQLNPH